MSKNEIILDGHSLTPKMVWDIAYSKKGETKVSLSSKSLEKMNQSREFVLKIVKEEKTTYGINTGFGALANKFISSDKLEELQYNLIRSHCTGVGKAFSKPVSRAIMLLRANCLIQGHSGINPDIVRLLIEFINNDIIPIIPEKGSVGASGDLAPLSHIALCLIGEGEVIYNNKRVASQFAIESIEQKPVKLGPKDGLALINGTAVMAALGCLALEESKILAQTADIVGAMTVDAVKGTTRAFDEKISKLKPHPGQVKVASNLRKILEGSEILTSHPDCDKVQDPYSLRCMPQVHGSCRQTFEHAQSILDIEINSVTDNPLVFPEENEVISGGNFHGEALAFCMDYMAMGLSELANMSERRVEKMMNPTFSELPAFLAKDSGLNSGFMIAHVTSAALVSENKIYSHPASVDSVPTSTDKEDHVSMGVTSGRKLHNILENVRYCLAIEILCNTQAIDFWRPLKSSTVIEKVYALIRKHVSFAENDRVFSKDIENISKLILRGEVLSIAKNEVEII